MRAKAFEVRDRGTFLPILAVDMNPSPTGGSLKQSQADAYDSQEWLLQRVGYACDGLPNVLITLLQGKGGGASNDPYSWGDRTFTVAHNHIIDHWNDLNDGDVIDVEFILGETKEPKQSERVTCP